MNKLINKYLSPTLYAEKELKLIPKALFGTGLFRRGLKWITNHTAPTREQTLFEVLNEGKKRLLLKKLSLKNRKLEDLQSDLLKLGYYKGIVDNKIGPKTRAAIELAQNDGYKIDMNNFTISKNNKESQLNNLNVISRVWNSLFKERKLTEEEYIQKRLQDIRNKAAQINKETVTPLFPIGNYIPNHDFDFYGTGSEGTAKAKNMTEKLVSLLFTKYRDEAVNYLETHPDISKEARNKVQRNINYYEKVIKDPKTVARKGSGIGFGCVYSATGAYDLEDLPLSTRNKLVYANNKLLVLSILNREDIPYKILPFIESNLKVGDIIQLGRNDTKIGPHHAVMVTGFDWLGRPKVTATNAGTAGMDDRAIDSYKEYIRILLRSNDDGDPNTPGIQPQGLQIVRFIGDSNLRNQWKREYNETYK